jgi:hypothetical protein
MDVGKELKGKLNLEMEMKLCALAKVKSSADLNERFFGPGIGKRLMSARWPRMRRPFKQELRVCPRP